MRLFQPAMGMAMSKALGKEHDSKDYWARETGEYVEALENQYHTHRLGVIQNLIPKGLYAGEKAIFDFGCGDAVHFPDFIKAGAKISGIDIAPEMIELAENRLSAQGMDPKVAKLGTVQDMAALPDASLDAILSFNVLAYLSDEEDRLFYQHAARTLRKGGYLVVTHSNELFDLFSLNEYTVEFFKRNFLTSPEHAHGLAELLPNSDNRAKPVTYNVRENPLTYPSKLARHGFAEVRQSFINLHPAPPTLLGKKTSYPDTLNVPEADRWKLMFQCSTYGSCSQRT